MPTNFKSYALSAWEMFSSNWYTNASNFTNRQSWPVNRVIHEVIHKIISHSLWVILQPLLSYTATVDHQQSLTEEVESNVMANLQAEQLLHLALWRLIQSSVSRFNCCRLLALDQKTVVQYRNKLTTRSKYNLSVWLVGSDNWSMLLLLREEAQ